MDGHPCCRSTRLFRIGRAIKRSRKRIRTNQLTLSRIIKSVSHYDLPNYQLPTSGEYNIMTVVMHRVIALRRTNRTKKKFTIYFWK